MFPHLKCLHRQNNTVIGNMLPVSYGLSKPALATSLLVPTEYESTLR